MHESNFNFFKCPKWFTYIRIGSTQVSLESNKHIPDAILSYMDYFLFIFKSPVNLCHDMFVLESSIQVADFGLAKFASDTDTHVSTRVMGTFG